MTTSVPSRRNWGGSTERLAARFKRFRARPFFGFEHDHRIEDSLPSGRHVRRDTNGYGFWRAGIEPQATILRFPHGNVRNEPDTASGQPSSDEVSNDTASATRGNNGTAPAGPRAHARGVITWVVAIAGIGGGIGAVVNGIGSSNNSIDNWWRDSARLRAEKCISPAIPTKLFIWLRQYECPSADSVIAESASSLRDRRYQEAIDGATVVLRAAPSVPALVVRGKAHAALGHVTEMKADLEAAARLAPRSYEVHFDRGTAYYSASSRPRQGSRALLEQAKASFSLALMIEPGSAEASHSLGLVYVALGNDVAAEAHFRHAIRHSDRRYAEPRVELALVYFRRGQLGRALATVDRVLDYSPGHSKASDAQKTIKSGIARTKAKKSRDAPATENSDNFFDLFKVKPDQNRHEGFWQAQSYSTKSRRCGKVEAPVSTMT
jgi:tetratricopeptide (TPR) repeat protein